MLVSATSSIDLLLRWHVSVLNTSYHLKFWNRLGFYIHSALRVKPYKALLISIAKRYVLIFTVRIKQDISKTLRLLHFLFQRSLFSAVAVLGFCSVCSSSSYRFRAQSVTDSIILNTFLNPSHKIYLQWRLCSSGAVDVRV